MQFLWKVYFIIYILYSFQYPLPKDPISSLTYEGVYYWIEDHLLPALYPDEYYNGEQISLEDSAMIIDSISYRVTPLRIAQHRAQPGANKFLRKEEKNQTNQKKLGSENVTMWLGRKKVEVDVLTSWSLLSAKDLNTFYYSR